MKTNHTISAEPDVQPVASSISGLQNPRVVSIQAEAQCHPLIQCKLSIGAVDDPLEDEADAMADKVMRTPEHNFIQRKCVHCEEEEKAQRKPLESFIQKKCETNHDTATDAMSSQLRARKGSGHRMPDSTKNFMESRFGADFSNVNIHTGSYASQLSNQLNAQAFTIGNDIYFNEGKYSPESFDGKALLAHELSHTIQQANDFKSTIQEREMEFNPSLIAVQLRDAMQGWGTEEAAMYAALAGRTRQQVEYIANAYKTLTRRELQADLESELSASELQRLALYGQVMGDTPGHRATAVAIQLRDAMAGWGTDENAIYVALQGRSQADLALINTAYFNLTTRQLMDDLRDELTDEELNKARGTMGLPPTVTVRNTELGMLSMGNFDFNFRNCAINIEVRLKFQFTDDITAAEQSAFKPRFINAVHRKWQRSPYKLVGGISCPCTDVPIRVNVIENSANYHKVVDVEKKTDQERRPMVVSDINVNLYTSDDTFMHEFGHVLGLYDEYDGGFFENIMFWHRNHPEDPDSLMNVGTELRPRFFEHYRTAANETAPMNCNYMVSR